MRSFYQDRLGTNIGKALKKDYRFLIGAEGLASVSVLTFPVFSNTAAFAFAEAGLVAANITAYSMGCKWLAGS